MSGYLSAREDYQTGLDVLYSMKDWEGDGRRGHAPNCPGKQGVQMVEVLVDNHYLKCTNCEGTFCGVPWCQEHLRI